MNKITLSIWIWILAIFYGYQTYAMGETPLQLTTNESTDFSPSWSPDGSKITFVSDRGGNYAIWLIPATGGNATSFSTVKGRVSFPS